MHMCSLKFIARLDLGAGFGNAVGLDFAAGSNLAELGLGSGVGINTRCINSYFFI